MQFVAFQQIIGLFLNANACSCPISMVSQYTSRFGRLASCARIFDLANYEVDVMTFAITFFEMKIGNQPDNCVGLFAWL